MIGPVGVADAPQHDPFMGGASSVPQGLVQGQGHEARAVSRPKSGTSERLHMLLPQPLTPITHRPTSQARRRNILLPFPF